jgi:prepilin-type N-terminal cleavage/methylation domain-containing protein
MRTKRGWTLIELLVVIAIIIVLAGITYAVVMYALEKSSQARCISNLRQIGIALKLYMEDYKQADWDTEIKASTVSGLIWLLRSAYQTAGGFHPPCRIWFRRATSKEATMC